MFKSLTNNFGIKLVCLLLSFFLWYALKDEQTVTETLRVDIEAQVGEDMFLMDVEPPYVELSLQATRRTMKKLPPPPYRHFVDLSGKTKPQTVSNYLTENDFSFDPQFKILKIWPARVEIEIDREIEKTLEIVAVTEGSPAPNFDLSEIRLNPSRLKVSGPEKILGKTEQLTTEKINIDGMTTNFIQEVQLVAPFKGFEVEQTVRASILFKKSKQTKMFEKIPVRVMYSPTAMFENCTVNPPEVGLQVEASVLDFQGVSADDFKAFVDIGGFSAGTYEVPVSIVKKDSFRITEIYPKSVEVTIGER
jgi:hypothetical protein